MKPGMTIRPVASMTAASPASTLAPMATIFFPSTSTSALAKSPIFGSIDMTEPPRIK
jgi:hypothetical protein